VALSIILTIVGVIALLRMLLKANSLKAFVVCGDEGALSVRTSNGGSGEIVSYFDTTGGTPGVPIFECASRSIPIQRAPNLPSVARRVGKGAKHDNNDIIPTPANSWVQIIRKVRCLNDGRYQSMCVCIYL